MFGIHTTVVFVLVLRKFYKERQAKTVCEVMSKRVILGVLLLFVLVLSMQIVSAEHFSCDAYGCSCCDAYGCDGIEISFKAAAVYPTETNDFPREFEGTGAPNFLYEDDSMIGCAPSEDYCIKLIPNPAFEGMDLCTLGACATPGSPWHIGTADENDEYIICSPYGVATAYGYDLSGAWLDLDQFNDSTAPTNACVAAGYELAYPGFSPTGYGGRPAGTETPVGEYPYVYPDVKKECCGDDADEVLVTEHCDGSGNSYPYCCPNDGYTYKIHNGDCIQADRCPDIQRTPPVWLGISDRGFWTQMNLALANDGNPNTFCCDSLEDPEQGFGEVMCDDPEISGSDGCILDTQVEFALSSTASEAYREYCSEENDDDFCVYDSGMDLSALETTMSCNETVYPVGLEPYLDLCYDTVRSVSEIACYETLPEGCDSSNVVGLGEGCYEVQERHCTGYGCEALCMINGDWTFCEEVCQSYTCEDITTYRGTCDYVPSSCTPNPSTEKCVIIGEPQIESFPLQDCEPYCWNCDGYSCEGCLDGWKYKETSCWEGEYQSEPLDIINCRNVDAQGERYEITESDGDTLYCDSVGSMNYGDPWCPLGYQFEEGFCKKDTLICDQGIGSNLQYGCDNIYTPDTDLLFSEYQKECVSRSVSAPDLVVYDQTCCYASSFNGFDLYEWGIEEDYVKIY